MIDTDVLISGLGPVGATLANLLGQQGLRVLAVERDTSVYPLPRAAHFDAEIMRVWQGLFSTLPSAPLAPGEQGIEWAYVAQGQFATTEAECTGARRYPFVAGFLPAEHLSCVERGLLDFFGFGDSNP